MVEQLDAPADVLDVEAPEREGRSTDPVAEVGGRGRPSGMRRNRPSPAARRASGGVDLRRVGLDRRLAAEPAAFGVFHGRIPPSRCDRTGTSETTGPRAREDRACERGDDLAIGTMTRRTSAALADPADPGLLVIHRNYTRGPRREKASCFRCLTLLEYDRPPGNVRAVPAGSSESIRATFEGSEALERRTYPTARDGSDRRPTSSNASGVRADEAGRLILEVGPATSGPWGSPTAGVIATLLDSVMGMDAHRSSPPDHYLVTAQLNVHFIRPGLRGRDPGRLGRGPPRRPEDGRRPGRDPDRRRRPRRDRLGHVRLRPPHRPDPGQPRPARTDPVRADPMADDPLDGFPEVVEIPVQWGDQDAFRPRQQHGLPPLVRVVEDRLHPTRLGLWDLLESGQHRADPGLDPLRLPPPLDLSRRRPGRARRSSGSAGPA